MICLKYHKVFRSSHIHDRILSWRWICERSNSLRVFFVASSRNWAEDSSRFRKKRKLNSSSTGGEAERVKRDDFHLFALNKQLKIYTIYLFITYSIDIFPKIYTIAHIHTRNRSCFEWWYDANREGSEKDFGKILSLVLRFAFYCHP